MNIANKQRSWSRHHSSSSRSLSHFGFDLGLEAHSVKANLQDVNSVLPNRTGCVAGSGGYSNIYFHPVFLEGLTLGVNGGFGLGKTNVNHLTNYVLDDTSYSVDYKYIRGGLGLELGTQISGNGGPVKVIAFWSRDFYINE